MRAGHEALTGAHDSSSPRSAPHHRLELLAVALPPAFASASRSRSRRDSTACRTSAARSSGAMSGSAAAQGQQCVCVDRPLAATPRAGPRRSFPSPAPARRPWSTRRDGAFLQAFSRISRSWRRLSRLARRSARPLLEALREASHACLLNRLPRRYRPPSPRQGASRLTTGALAQRRCELQRFAASVVAPNAHEMLTNA